MKQKFTKYKYNILHLHCANQPTIRLNNCLKLIHKIMVKKLSFLTNLKVSSTTKIQHYFALNLLKTNKFPLHSQVKLVTQHGTLDNRQEDLHYVFSKYKLPKL